ATALELPLDWQQGEPILVHRPAKLIQRGPLGGELGQELLTRFAIPASGSLQHPRGLEVDRHAAILPAADVAVLEWPRGGPRGRAPDLRAPGGHPAGRAPAAAHLRGALQADDRPLPR